MARAGLAVLAEAVFEKDGKRIPYRKVTLTRAARSADETTPIEFVMKDTAAPASTAKGGKRKGKKRVAAAAAGSKPAKRKPTRKVVGKAPPAPAAASKMIATPAKATAPKGPDKRLEDALKNWRLAEAKRMGVPAFRILTDRALQAMATTRPVTAAELLAIPGIGIATVKKYGRQIYRILNSSG